LRTFVTFDSEVLFFGSKGKGIKFNSETNSLTEEETMKMACGGTFGNHHPIGSISNGKVYALSNEGDLHIMKDGKWICIKGIIR